ncbi:hypothetical protein [Methanococcoides methylutens]|uniref:DUF4825 domain-containing protein n=1 Tax=Methanococcoides methylutens MM1 TaxID=1434104 RepID=A0A0E3SSV2_METMT|nr:hypothetical protein [Methanococcoides methylutens]AKB85592.1 hypothetical protein MCMEM_1539 [Methanococcoides methylutens MM1]
MIKKIIAGVFILFILLLFMGGDDGGNTPTDIDITEWKPVMEGTDREYQAQSMGIYETLAFSGFEKASVKVTDEYVLMAYEQPPVHSEVDALLSWFYMMGAAAELAPHTEQTIIRMYSDDVALYEIEAYTSDVQEILDYEMELDEFRSRVTVRALM